MAQQLIWSHQAFDHMLKMLEAGKVSRDRIADVVTRLLIAAPDWPAQTEIAAPEKMARSNWPAAQKLKQRNLPDLLPDSVSRAVNALGSMHLITQHKPRADRPGRPYTPLQLGSKHWAMVGIKVEHQEGRVIELSVLVTNLDGTPLDIPTYQGPGDPCLRPVKESDDPVEALATVIEEMCSLPAVRQRYILGVGIEIAGHVMDGEVVDASLNSMYGRRLGWQLSKRLDELTERLNRIIKNVHPLPVILDNDVNVLGVLETYKPRFPELDLAVVAVFDDGIGSALIVNGRVYRGGNGMAGEIGHNLVETSRISVGVDADTDRRPLSATPAATDQLSDSTSTEAHKLRFSDPCNCGDPDSSHLDCYSTPERLRGENGGRDFDEIAACPVKIDDKFTPEGRSFSLAGQALGIAIANLLNIVNPARVLIFLPPALADPQPGTAAAEYRLQIKAMVRGHGFSTSKKTPIVVDQLDSDSRRYFGAQAAAVRVIDSFLEHAKRQCSCYAPKAEPEQDEDMAEDGMADTLDDDADARV